MEMIVINTENNKTNEPHKSVLNSQKLDLESSKKLVYLSHVEKYKTTVQKQ